MELKLQNRGFTLIELLVVIAIIGLLSTLAVVSLNNARGKSRDAKRVADIKQIQTALELYYADQNSYPVTNAPVTLGIGSGVALSAAIGGWSASTQAPVYMGTVPANPAPNGSPYIYAINATGATYSITFSLEGATGALTSGPHTADQSGIK